MPFKPIVVGNGLVAWRNLQRSLPQQLERFAKAPVQDRVIKHFEEKAQTLTSGNAVVSDRQILTVALGAYGLQDDLQSRFFISKILDEGVSQPNALANRMTDSRYKRLAGDFAFDGLSRITGVLDATAKKITSNYVQQAFAEAVGQNDQSLRLALNADGEFQRIAAQDISDDAKWYLVMGNPPLRSVVETSLGLPNSFGRLDIDQQLDVFRAKSASSFGVTEIDDLANVEKRGTLIDLFLLKQQVLQGSSFSSNSIALQLLNPGV